MLVTILDDVDVRADKVVELIKTHKYVVVNVENGSSHMIWPNDGETVEETQFRLRKMINEALYPVETKVDRGFDVLYKGKLISEMDPAEYAEFYNDTCTRP